MADDLSEVCDACMFNVDPDRSLAAAVYMVLHAFAKCVIQKKTKTETFVLKQMHWQ